MPLLLNVLLLLEMRALLEVHVLLDVLLLPDVLPVLAMPISYLPSLYYLS